MESDQQEMRIYYANEKQLTSEVATKPYVLSVELPTKSTFVSVFSLPNLMTMLGLGGQAGPPGYAFLVDPLETRTTVRYFVSRVADNPFDWRSDHLVLTYCGLLTVVGVPVGIFEVSYDPENPEARKEMGGVLKDICVIDGVRYRTPPELLRRVAPGLGTVNGQGD